MYHFSVVCNFACDQDTSTGGLLKWHRIMMNWSCKKYPHFGTTMIDCLQTSSRKMKKTTSNMINHNEKLHAPSGSRPIKSLKWQKNYFVMIYNYNKADDAIIMLLTQLPGEKIISATDLSIAGVPSHGRNFILI